MTDTTIPRRLCDLVMKGGVTSGVVYPLAICELSKHYNFRNIGGTSAGAIAAAAAAAAEYGRRSKRPLATAFKGLAELPEWIGKPGRLLKMFSPDRSTRALFRILMAAMNPRTLLGKLLSVSVALLLHFWVASIASAILVVAISIWLRGYLDGIAFAYGVISTLMVALVAFLALVSLFLYRQITKTLPRNLYGIARGFDPKTSTSNAEAPLTNWLTRYLNELAGKQLSTGPLTFGDLYGVPAPDGDPTAGSEGYKSINLEMMTTALNLGRPYRLPFRDPDQIFYFTREDFERLFPKEIVDYMVNNSPSRDPIVPQLPSGETLYAFPEPEHVPVVVATRMSLSFPVLLSAVPLYAVDYSLKENKDKTKAARAERCWFSDGGICSNLPIHFFDAPIPRWPTFAINLKQFHPDFQEEKDAVWLPQSAGSGWMATWARFEEAGGYMTDFLWAIVNTMQNWQDNTQSRIPGYRDRMVHVSQRNDEGGLNLDMPEAVINKLADRGKRAGVKLVERFSQTAAQPSGGWTAHRWVRFRSCMALTETWLGSIARGYSSPISPDPKIKDILLGNVAVELSYRLDPGDAARASNCMDALEKLSTDWGTGTTGFQSEAPKPTPELRIRPRV
ncbi:MAG TPA: patatin-like phospholipase family protein [Burkholderiales bacterium]|nr:patatin-like phospholipase family protein [Burkholderiales bacterium]